MSLVLSLLCLALIVGIAFQHHSWKAKMRAAEQRHAEARAEFEEMLRRARADAEASNAVLMREIETLAPFREVKDASRKAEELRMQAAERVANARADAQQLEQDAKLAADAIITQAKAEAADLKRAAEIASQTKRLEAETMRTTAAQQAEDIIRSARTKAEEIAATRTGH